MRYVAIAAAAAAFWLLVATARLLVGDGTCHYPRETAETNEHASAPAAQRFEPLPGPPPPDGHNPIRKLAVIRGMNRVKPLIARCYQDYRVPGIAIVSMVIASSGRVSSAIVTGKFEGTPTGACVEAAVKTARFSPSDGVGIAYSFQLR